MKTVLHFSCFENDCRIPVMLVEKFFPFRKQRKTRVEEAKGEGKIVEAKSEAKDSAILKIYLHVDDSELIFRER